MARILSLAFLLHGRESAKNLALKFHEIPKNANEKGIVCFSSFGPNIGAQKICSNERVLVAACHFSTWEAESYVKDLVTATEGTRQVEMKEQAVARECMQELNEIHAAQTREDLGAEAKLNQLIRELETLAKGWAIIAVSGAELLSFEDDRSVEGDSF